MLYVRDNGSASLPSGTVPAWARPREEALVPERPRRRPLRLPAPLRHRPLAQVLPLGLVAAAVAGLLVGLAVPAQASTTYMYPDAFTTSSVGNQQGLARAGDAHEVAYDVGGGDAVLVRYDDAGRELSRTGRLPLGHAAEVAYRPADGLLYVSTGGAQAASAVNAVDVRRSPAAVVRTFPYGGALAGNAMVAVDQVRDRMLVFGGPSAGPWTYAWADWAGRTGASFTTPAFGVPQGLEVVGDEVLVLTSAPGHATITVLDLAGRVRRSLDVPVADEAEGLSADPRTGRLWLGFHDPGRVAAVTPAYRTETPLGTELLADPGADAGGLGAWTVAGGMQALPWSAGGGYPGLASPGPATGRGRALFAGGSAAVATATQRVDLTSLSARTDGGGTAYDLTGWLGGYRVQQDRAGVVARFLDGGGRELGRAVLAPVTAADRGGVTGLLRRSAAGTVPPGSRAVEVVLTATRAAGTHDDGYADALSLVLHAR